MSGYTPRTPLNILLIIKYNTNLHILAEPQFLLFLISYFTFPTLESVQDAFAFYDSYDNTLIFKSPLILKRFNI